MTAIAGGTDVTVDLSAQDALKVTFTVINDKGEANHGFHQFAQNLYGTVTAIGAAKTVSVDL